MAKRDRKVSVAIVHPRLGRGGSEARVMWAAEALKVKFAVSIITTGTVDLDELNRFYGTNVTHNEVVVRSLWIPHFLVGIDSMAALRGALFQRALHNIVSEYSVLISAYNICDFGVAGIHCIADFSWDEQVRAMLHPVPTGARGTVHRFRYLRRLYLGITELIADRSKHNALAGEDIIIANSHWSAKILRDKYDLSPIVLYPPVARFCGAVPSLTDRPRKFVCIGRISSEKRIERIIKIISEVRRQGHHVLLHIVGDLDGTVYAKRIEALARLNSEWIIVEGEKRGAAKVGCLMSCGYGIHACEGEAFGIGVAEMVKAGCITFAPAEGGQAEIVNHPALLYRNDDEAVEKIIAVLKREALRAELIHHLRRQAEKFSSERFTSGLGEAVDQFLAGSWGRSGIDKPQAAV